ncbi:ribonuclease P protein component [Melioribacter sp. Ez-97]|uniref:ribonuclease P protein component n=1 Tax=Melioribacter sp. Ez-97 TaxID=3423434 RepID=UPI003ED924B6
MKQYGLSAAERIKRKKDFELVYNKGNVLISPSKKLKVIFYAETQAEDSGVKTAYAVARKSGKAVWRNRIKRLMRESYRLNKSILTELCKENNLKLLLVFASHTMNQTRNKKVKLSEVMPEVVDLMKKVKDRLESK